MRRGECLSGGNECRHQNVVRVIRLGRTKIRFVDFIGHVDPHLCAGGLTVAGQEFVKGRTQLGAKFGRRVDRREPLLKLRFGPTSIPILRCVDVSLSGHSVIAHELRRSEPPMSCLILIGIPRSRIGQSLL